METKIRKVGTMDHVNLYFDPLRKDDTFLLMKKAGDGQAGFLMIPPEAYGHQDELQAIKTKIEAEDVDVILEANSGMKWKEVTGIIAGFKDIEMFKKIKEKFNEENK